MVVASELLWKHFKKLKQRLLKKKYQDIGQGLTLALMDDCTNADKKAENKMLKAENQTHLVRKTSVVWRRQKYHHSKYLSILKYLFHNCMQCSNINTPLIQTKMHC